MYSNASNLDKFTVKNKLGIGNQQLEYPIALMTADEVAYAGGVYANKNENTYYTKNSKDSSITGDTGWWTMSPIGYYSFSSKVYMVINSETTMGGIFGTTVDNTINAARPVLSIKACATWKSGDGTVSSPYEVEVDDACALADN